MNRTIGSRLKLLEREAEMRNALIADAMRISWRKLWPYVWDYAHILIGDDGNLDDWNALLNMRFPLTHDDATTDLLDKQQYELLLRFYDEVFSGECDVLLRGEKREQSQRMIKQLIESGELLPPGMPCKLL